jgi:hypothetical protein
MKKGNRYESLDNGTNKRKASPLVNLFQSNNTTNETRSTLAPSSSSFSAPRYTSISNGVAAGQSLVASTNPFDDDYHDTPPPVGATPGNNPFADAEEEGEVTVSLAHQNARPPPPPLPPKRNQPPATVSSSALSPVHADTLPLSAQQYQHHRPPESTRQRPSTERGVEMTVIPSKQQQKQQKRIDRGKQQSEQSRNQLKKHLHKIEKHVEKNSTDAVTGHPMALTEEDENAVIRFLVAKRGKP